MCFLLVAYCFAWVLKERVSLKFTIAQSKWSYSRRLKRYYTKCFDKLIHDGQYLLLLSSTPQQWNACGISINNTYRWTNT